MMFYAILSLCLAVEAAPSQPQASQTPAQISTSSGAVIVLDRVENGQPIYRYVSGPTKAAPVVIPTTGLPPLRFLMPTGSPCVGGNCPKR